jgi:transcriptional regulator NrdR family protein
MKEHRSVVFCPKCKSDNVFILETVPQLGWLRRRRQCNACKHRYSTVEILHETAKFLFEQAALAKKLQERLREAIGESERPKNPGAYESEFKELKFDDD